MHVYLFQLKLLLIPVSTIQLTQNHRMLGVGRDLCGSSSPTLLPKQGHLQQAAQDHVQAGLEYLQRRRLHNLPGQPVPVLHHPQREEVLPHVQTEPASGSDRKCSCHKSHSFVRHIVLQHDNLFLELFGGKVDLSRWGWIFWYMKP